MLAEAACLSIKDPWTASAVQPRTEAKGKAQPQATQMKLAAASHCNRAQQSSQQQANSPADAHEEVAGHVQEVALAVEPGPLGEGHVLG